MSKAVPATDRARQSTFDANHRRNERVRETTSEPDAKAAAPAAVAVDGAKSSPRAVEHLF